MDLEQKIRAFILDSFLFTDDQSALSSQDSLLEKGIIDSTGVLEVIAFLEQEFGVAVEDEEMIPENLDSVANLVAFIQRKRAAA
ncbi:MAG: acyl carrier protein [Candidatus Krumholzibacteria bacterium]|jgi:acyl carrier protein|nr:acyl carrier protein [Candidatus Krumholzibacteria bacterium]MDY0109427.1 acyl carrier protein [Candidatus Krumholzibacteria bacterium]